MKHGIPLRALCIHSMEEKSKTATGAIDFLNTQYFTFEWLDRLLARMKYRRR